MFFQFSSLILKLDWNERFDNPPGSTSFFANAYTIMDGTLCQIERPLNSETRKACTSGKYHKYGYLYLLVVRSTDGKIVRYYGPHKGAGNDLNVLYKSSFFEDRTHEEKTFGDGIFRSIPNFICPQHGSGHYDVRDKVISDIRSTVEHINSRLKSWSCLSHPWRQHDSKKHELVFHVCCKLINFLLITNPVQEKIKQVLQ